VAAPDVEGGDAMALEFCLGGSRGGRLGGFGLAAGDGRGRSAISLRTGGGGRWDVDRPVVSARNGAGGGLGFVLSSSSAILRCSSSSARLLFACISSCDNGAPRPRLSGVIYLVRMYVLTHRECNHLVGESGAAMKMDVLRRWAKSSRILQARQRA